MTYAVVMSKTDSSKGKKRPPRLGRGLSSLMGSPVSAQPPAVDSVAPVKPVAAVELDRDLSRTEPSPKAGRDPQSGMEGQSASVEPELFYPPIAEVQPNQQQPRTVFAEAELSELARSIAEHGVMQPVAVRRRADGGFELIAGERRWRAAKAAGLDRIPAVLHDVSDQTSAEWALVENLQRSDLNPIESAQAFQMLVERYGLSHAEVAERVGLNRSSVSNLLRLLKLTPEVQQMVSRGTLAMGHARALIGLTDVTDQIRLAERAVREGWSVRRLEQAVKEAAATPSTADVVTRPTSPKAAYLGDLERQIAAELKTKVRLKQGRKKGSGTLAIDFFSIDEFDELMRRMQIETT